LKALDATQDGLERILESLYQAYKTEGDGKVRERILMNIRLFEGKSLYEIGDEFRCVPSKAHYWKRRFRKMSVEGLKDRPRSGRPRLLSGRKEKMIRRIIERPRITKENVSSWSTTHVRELIRREAGVTYTTRHVIRLMHRWGFEKIKPRPEHCRAASKQARRWFFKK
jgi:putative transposase